MELDRERDAARRVGRKKRRSGGPSAELCQGLPSRAVLPEGVERAPGLRGGDVLVAEGPGGAVRREVLPELLLPRRWAFAAVPCEYVLGPGRRLAAGLQVQRRVPVHVQEGDKRQRWVEGAVPGDDGPRRGGAEAGSAAGRGRGGGGVCGLREDRQDLARQTPGRGKEAAGGGQAGRLGAAEPERGGRGREPGRAAREARAAQGISSGSKQGALEEGGDAAGAARPQGVGVLGVAGEINNNPLFLRYRPGLG